MIPTVGQIVHYFPHQSETCDSHEAPATNAAFVHRTNNAPCAAMVCDVDCDTDPQHCAKGSTVCDVDCDNCFLNLLVWDASGNQHRRHGVRMACDENEVIAAPCCKWPAKVEEKKPESPK